MPVVRILGEEATRLAPTRYRDEAQLQALLAAHPYLLMDDGEPDVAFVDREVTLKGTGRLDLLLVDAEGRPVAVEVKLGRNVQSRREVVAQVFDYVAALSDYTAQELDRVVDGKLTAALEIFEDEDAEDEDANAVERRRWDVCGAALRNGNVRVVIAVDEAGADLVRLVRFINDHSDLDVRLVEIARFTDKATGTTLVPKILVRTSQAPARKRRKRKPPRPEFEAVVNAYDQTVASNRRTTGRARAYRQIKLGGWPGGLHFEFMDHGDEMGVELHIESNAALLAQETVRESVDAAARAIPAGRATFDPRWSRGRGRLVVRLPSALSPADVAHAMVRLIEVTEASVEAALNQDG
jgi:hypothetical protein